MTDDCSLFTETMFDFSDLGKLLVIVGAITVALGVLFSVLARVPFVGRLPGDIAIEGQGFSCFIPLATSIILSIVLTIILNLLIRVFNR